MNYEKNQHFRISSKKCRETSITTLVNQPLASSLNVLLEQHHNKTDDLDLCWDISQIITLKPNFYYLKIELYTVLFQSSLSACPERLSQMTTTDDALKSR